MDGYSDKGKFTPKPNCPTPTTCRLAGECQGGCIRKGRARDFIDRSTPEERKERKINRALSGQKDRYV